MLDRFREGKQGCLVKGILLLITIPFALFGVDYYFRNSGGRADVVATVEGQKITQFEFNQALKDQSDNYRNILGKNFDPAIFDNPQARRSVLESIINQRLLAEKAQGAGLTVTTSELASKISEVPAFQVDGKFATERYTQFLRSQGMSTSGFEARLRQDLLVQKMRDTVVNSTLLPASTLEHYVRINEQQREVSTATISPGQFAPMIKVSEDAKKAYYAAHPEEFKIPEQVKLEYVFLSAEQLAAEAQVSDEEVKKAYDEAVARGLYQQKEERQASHILISVAPDASEADKKTARAKAEELLKQATATPEQFAALAEKNSQDPGSAKQGGDLGFFARGSMVKAFDEAAFAMKPGEIRGPVETDFGFHVIKLVAVKPEQIRKFDEVKSELAQDLKKQKAGKKLAEVADNFANLVYEQSTSLKPAADSIKQQVKQSGWVTKSGAADDPLLNNPKLLEAVFSSEVLKDKRNTAPIEIAPNMLVAARVVDYKAAASKPFNEASAAIEQKLKQEEGAKSALKLGKEKLALLQQGKAVVDLVWSAPKLVTRQGQSDLAEAVLTQAFKAPAGKLPAYASDETPGGGITLVRVTKLAEAAKVDDAKRKSASNSLKQTLAQEEFAAIMSQLRAKSDITMKPDALEKKER
jgi:peptidyl-prolyl cis-trans isomerase D